MIIDKGRTGYIVVSFYIFAVGWGFFLEMLELEGFFVHDEGIVHVMDVIWGLWYCYYNYS